MIWDSPIGLDFFLWTVCKTVRLLLRCLVISVPSTSLSVISLSRIGSGLEKSVLNGAPRVKWSRISLWSRFRGPCFANLGTDLSSLLGCRFWTRLLGSQKHVSRSQYVLIRKLWEIKVWFLYLKESSKEWWYMCALCRILHDPVVFGTCYWWTHVSISLVWLYSQESLLAWLTNDRPRMSSYPGSTTYAMIS